MTGTCEIRVPTFRRPELLRRALNSLVAQTYRDWTAIVFDDSPERGAETVVKSVDDSRIHYRHNGYPLGAIGNIDQSFRKTAFAGGLYACVLEDDNYFFSNHIETQVRSLRCEEVDVIFAAQYCEEVLERNSPGQLTNARTLTWIYREGRHDATLMVPSLLFSHGFSNGAAFWRVGCRSNFEIGLAVTSDPGVQESLRLLRLCEPVFVSHTCTAVWRSNSTIDSFVNSKPTSRFTKKMKRLKEQRAIMDYRLFFIEKFGVSAVPGFIEYHKLQSRTMEIEKGLLLCGVSTEALATNRGWKNRLMLTLKGRLFRACFPRQLQLQSL